MTQSRHILHAMSVSTAARASPALAASRHVRSVLHESQYTDVRAHGRRYIFTVTPENAVRIRSSYIRSQLVQTNVQSQPTNAHSRGASAPSVYSQTCAGTRVRISTLMQRTCRKRPRTIKTKARSRLPRSMAPQGAAADVADAVAHRAAAVTDADAAATLATRRVILT